jgi:hypothetical protein
MPTYDPIVEAHMPNLENLKKQAKLILHWHREQYYPVAAQIRALMPRFSNMPDSEILAANFKLSDAQEMVARQHGFDSWQALKGGLSTTSRKVKPSPSKATIVCAEPQLFVTDIKRACEFFQNEVRLYACIQLRRTSLLRTGGSRRGASQFKVRRATSNRVDGPRSRGTVVGIYDRRFSGRDQDAVS